MSLKTSELLLDLSDEQQELVAGGGPTLGIVAEATKYITNQAPVYSIANAGPSNSTATGFAQPVQLESAAAQLSLGAAGIPNLAVPGNLSFPTGNTTGATA
jgi:hypothetical protein